MVYLLAIVLANLTTTMFGPEWSVVNAFLFIGLDLTSRDKLHEAWGRHNLWPRMIILVGTGSLLSLLLNTNSSRIAAASLIAFMLAGLTDSVAYAFLHKKRPLTRINVSNLFAAGVDSIVFPLLAFGWPPLLLVIVGQFLAKTLGGFMWSLVIVWWDTRHLKELKKEKEQLNGCWESTCVWYEKNQSGRGCYTKVVGFVTEKAPIPVIIGQPMAYTCPNFMVSKWGTP